MNGYDKIHELKRDLRAQGIKVNIPDLLALSSGNDPFYSGSPANIKNAEWFCDVLERFSLGDKFHIRKVHYRMVSPKAEPHKKPNGMAYENTDSDWGFLNACARQVRYQGLIDPERFRDKRNAEPYHYTDRSGYASVPYIEEPYVFSSLPSIDAHLGSPHLEVDSLEIFGYDYELSMQPYSLWIVIEKSTEAEVITPICRKNGATYLEGTGFQSITRALGLIRRESFIKKPVRIFWLSDFDPAGESMPVSMARQIEFWGQGHDIDIKLEHLLLTQEQCARYELPRTPIKPKDKRRAGWEKRYGEGATELDALDAIHPGELDRVVREAVEPYVDHSLCDKTNAARAEAKKAVSAAWAEATTEENAELAVISQEAREIAEKYVDEINELSKRLKGEMAPFEKRLETISHAVRKKAPDMDKYLLDLPKPDVQAPDESEWLFDIGRDYLTQLAMYHRSKGARLTSESA